MLSAAAFAGGRVHSRLFPGAVTSLGGLTLRVTLPQSHYGPGEAIRAYCTFTNMGQKSVRLPPSPPLTAVILEGDLERVFPQEPDCRGLGQAPGPVLLAPGERAVRCVTVTPGRKDLLPGEFPFRVYCVLGAGGSPAGTLASDEVPLRVRYNVFWVN